ncbi:hypothetical protein LS74_000050 [Helicobacter magdeburgensis]|uniref:Uncharacterized protein n=1 Tax=Helicobacter magdeburgensis TaxID=471858 RepID=A0A4U8T2R8_9HELI|nr:hypothetical protein [Helicobacter magdeburgensis]TLD93779.1 hypothetical protein LS74_000010 [Helicobacter magdeburgensis]TLD93784.1 hypothetical protein LS74_000050 [Helicobacter magdeburgensis]
MIITIENANKEFLKAVREMAKIANLKVKATKTEADLSKADTQNLKEIYTQYKRGELETISFKELDKQAQAHLKNLRAKYAN